MILTCVVSTMQGGDSESYGSKETKGREEAGEAKSRKAQASQAQGREEA